jgi:hypothetical protein
MITMEEGRYSPPDLRACADNPLFRRDDRGTPNGVSFQPIDFLEQPSYNGPQFSGRHSPLYEAESVKEV